MKKPLALLIIILIINLPIAIADETTQGITDMPERSESCGNNKIDQGEECDPPFSTSVMGKKYNPEPCIQKLRNEGKTEQEIKKEQHYNFITCSEQCTCSIESKPTITPFKPSCGNNVINQGEECDPPYYSSNIINPTQCKTKYNYSQQKAFCNEDCECQETTDQNRIISQDNIPVCGNYNLEQRELCDSTATNGVIKCEEEWKNTLRSYMGYDKEEIQDKLRNEIDHFECSTQCDACTPIPKTTTTPPPLTKCGNNAIDKGEDCDPPSQWNDATAIEQCKKHLFNDKGWDNTRINEFTSKHNMLCGTDPATGDKCVCMAQEKQAEETNCGELEKQIKQRLKDAFDEENLAETCALKEWIKASIDELNKQTNCNLSLDKFFKDLDKKCQKFYKDQEGPGIKKAFNWIKKGISLLIPKWVKRIWHWMWGERPCSNGTDVGIFQHRGCNNEGQTCLYEPELSWTYAYQFYPIWFWDILLNKITGTDLSMYVWGRCDQNCNCLKDDDYNNKVNEFIERFKQEIKAQVE